MNRLTGKTCLIVGGGGGLGAASAIAMASEGARVMVADFRRDSAERIAQEIVTSGGLATWSECDIRDRASIQNTVNETVADFGGVDVMQCLADMTPGAGQSDDYQVDALKIPLSAWQATLEINMTGYLMACRAVMPELVKSPASSIILMSSVSAIRSLNVFGAHGAAKAGVQALANHLAVAYGKQNVRVNTILPGVVVTPEREEDWIKSGFQEMQLRHTPLPRLATASDVAHLAVFLASDESGAITGQPFLCDSGTSIVSSRWTPDDSAVKPTLDYD